MNPRSPQVTFSVLGSGFGIVRFIEGLSSGAPVLDQMVWRALFVAGALLTVYFLRMPDVD